jgi:uncharacterized protein (TIGR00375 family)
MHIITDLQIHSKYSRAVSQQMVLPQIWQWAKRKGIGLMATGDWTHPLWMREIKAHLEEAGNGLFKLKKTSLADIASVEEKWDGDKKDTFDPYFMLATEVSSIYSQGGKGRRIHTLIWVSSLASADKIIQKFEDRGCNLLSDGRPIIGLTSIEVCDIVLSTDPTALVIPAHAWTPWFSLYGSESGFDSIAEAFGNFSKYIYAIETGLSSNPAMNWRIKDLDTRSLVSFSDSHSGPKIGREATVFDLEEISYKMIRRAIMRPFYQASGEVQKVTSNKIAYTVEFYPEEGKYHYTGHRNCGIKQTPEETKKKGIICPVCGRKLTIGVMHRVEQLAGRSIEDLKLHKKVLPDTQMQSIYSKTFPDRPAFVMLVPLAEIIAEVLHTGATTQKVQSDYIALTDHFGGEFNVLLNARISDIATIVNPQIAQAIEKVRTGDIVVDPGYDGTFGVVKIFSEDKKEESLPIQTKDQLSMF